MSEQQWFAPSRFQFHFACEFCFSHIWPVLGLSIYLQFISGSANSSQVNQAESEHSKPADPIPIGHRSVNWKSNFVCPADLSITSLGRQQELLPKSRLQLHASQSTCKSKYIVLYYIILHYVILYNINFAILCYNILHRIVSYCLVLYWITLHYILLHYTLHCIMVYYLTICIHNICYMYNIHIHIHIYTYIYIYAYIHIYIYTYTHIYIYTSIHLYIYTSIHLYIYTSIHTYIHT